MQKRNKGTVVLPFPYLLPWDKDKIPFDAVIRTRREGDVFTKFGGGTKKLKEFLDTINIEKVEVLPYHTMGIPKYEKLGIPYPLEGVPAAYKNLVLEKKQIVLRAISETKQNN